VGCKICRQDNHVCVEMPNMKFTWIFMNLYKSRYCFENFLSYFWYFQVTKELL